MLCYMKAFCPSLLNLDSSCSDSCLPWGPPLLFTFREGCYGWADSSASTGFPRRYQINQSCSCRERSSFPSVSPGLEHAEHLVYLIHTDRNFLRSYHLSEWDNFSRIAKIMSKPSRQHPWQIVASHWRGSKRSFSLYGKISSSLTSFWKINNFVDAFLEILRIR